MPTHPATQTTDRPTPTSRISAASLALLYPLFFAAVFLAHLTLLRLPYFWDEGGYYIPAAWDFFRTGTLIPVTTASNAHPPLPSIFLAAWWHLAGFSPLATRTFICLIAAAALLAVYRITRNLLNTSAAAAATILTALYPVWFTQSTLAHADIFAAAFTLWALSFYLDPTTQPTTNPGAPHLDSEIWVSTPTQTCKHHLFLIALLFSLASLSKETAILTPAALALWEFILLLRTRTARTHLAKIAALLFPILPLAAWYAYHHHRTGFTFGNPEFLRYNATANLGAYRIALCLYHRLLHLTLHMNLFVPVLATLAVLFLPPIADRIRIPRPTLHAIAVILISNWIAFSVLGGALLTRYLLPLYPLILILCIAQWQRRIPRRWPILAALSAAAFLAGLWINPPYAFAPEDNLTYRDFIVLHQHAVAVIAQRWPQAKVLTAWPAFSELERPELGYTTHSIQAIPIQNFTLEQLQTAATHPTTYDTALIFSTKWSPPPGHLNLTQHNSPTNNDTRYFDFHEDARPAQAATILHGQVVWQQSIKGEWVAILRFPHTRLTTTPAP
ncbi:MAG TPA: glycosyltransferase family 39 protein [Acidobacteriaceae bacterium]|nr:glycosyltransferase family 39 protein [Acidobacteriaceae bacterium]